MPKCEISGVVTAPETFSISYRPQGVKNVLFADVKSHCENQGINCVVMEGGMKDPSLFAKVSSWNPDMFIVVGWYHMVPTSWRNLAPTYGLHASLLPDYSGGAPLVWAIINGESMTGITFFEFADRVDNGPIVGQLATSIYPEDTIATLYERIQTLGGELIQEYLPRLIDGTAVLIPQDETKRRLFPQRSPEDGKIDWSWPAQQIHNFIRAQTKPYPGAFTIHGGNKVTIWSSRLVRNSIEPQLHPGEIRALDEKLFVRCGDGEALELTKIALNGTDELIDIRGIYGVI